MNLEAMFNSAQLQLGTGALTSKLEKKMRLISVTNNHKCLSATFQAKITKLVS